MGTDRTLAGGVFQRRAGALSGDLHRLPQGWRRADRHLPPFQQPALDRRDRRVGEPADSAAFCPILRAGGTGVARRRRYGVHDERTQCAGDVVRDARRQGFEGEAAIVAQAARALGSDRFGSWFMGDSLRVRDVCLSAHALGREAIKAAIPAYVSA